MKRNKRVATASLVVLLVTAAIQVAAIAKEKTKPAQAPAVQEQLVWPAPPAQARIKWVAEYRNEFDVGAKKRKGFIDRLAGKGEDSLRLKRPLSVAVDDAGVVVVGDMEQGVILMDPVAHKVLNFSSTQGGKFLGVAVGVAIDSKLVFVCDANSNSVSLFDREGRFLKGLAERDGIKRPVGVAVDEAKNLVIVVNAGNNEVLLLDRGLTLIKKFGNRGGGPAQFNFPTYVTMLPGTGFAVMDTGNFRVQIFDANGRFIRQFGKAGDASGLFSRPKGITTDPDGHLYVADSNFCNVQVFNPDGQVLTFFGDGGTARGRFTAPCGIGSNASGLIAVADELNSRIQLFQYLKGGEEGAGGAKK